MKHIPYSHQYIDNADIKAVIAALKSKWLTQGPKIREFEDALCKYTGARYAVAVSSGTAALNIACLAAGLKSNDKVITSPVTFIASANCVLHCGGRPVFADVREDTANIDPEEIVKKITKGTKVLIPVHFAGHPCELDKINQIAARHNLLVIEDAAHALGAEYKNSKIGSCKYSDMTILSFHPVKSITTGEGGAILTNNKNLYEKSIMLKNHGVTRKSFMNESKGGWYYEMQLLGYNYRMTDIQAALGVSQLKKLDKFVARRRRIAKIYEKNFKDNPHFATPVEKEDAFSSYHLYPIRLRGKYKRKRREIFSKMRKMGLGVQVHYIPVHLQPYYKKVLGYKKGDCAIAESYYAGTLSLPLYPSMTDEDISRVINCTKECLNGE